VEDSSTVLIKLFLKVYIKMRLLRLTTTDPTAIFDAEFNETLTLPKDSKIALQNVSVEAKTNVLVLDTQNNTIEYQNTPAGTISVNLTTGTFTGNTLDTLLEDITDRLNESTVFTGANTRVLGLEWRAEEPRSKKVTIGYKQGAYGEFATSWKYKPADVVRTTTDAGTWGRPTGINTGRADVGANMLFPDFLSRGCGYTRFKILDLFQGPLPDEETGMVLGLTSREISDNADLTLADIKYGIWARFDTGATVYYLIRDGVATNSTIPAQLDDFVELMINGDKIQAGYYRAGSTTATNIIEYDYTVGEKLYPVNVFHGNRARANVNNVRVSQSPYNPNALKAEHANELQAPRTPTQTPSQNFLNFGSVEVANFLGFTNQRQPQTGFYNVHTIDYIADKQFDGTVIADAFLIEMLNIPLDSYDSFVKQRKNILAVVPQSDKDGQVIYEPSTPFFIDVKNDQDLLLRNIRLRIVNPDYTPFEMNGLATVTLLIS
jgi:hypothetical protein